MYSFDTPSRHRFSQLLITSKEPTTWKSLLFPTTVKCCADFMRYFSFCYTSLCTIPPYFIWFVGLGLVPCYSLVPRITSTYTTIILNKLWFTRIRQHTSPKSVYRSDHFVLSTSFTSRFTWRRNAWCLYEILIYSVIQVHASRAGLDGEKWSVCPYYTNYIDTDVLFYKHVFLQGQTERRMYQGECALYARK